MGAEPISFEYHPNAQTSFKPPLIANENAFLGDVFTSESNDPSAPISAGFYRLEKGENIPSTQVPSSSNASLAER